MTDTPPVQRGETEARYEKFATARQPYLDRGRDCAKLTIPSVLPDLGQKAARLPTAYNGLGARGVKNLTSKLALALFPSNVPFFRLAIDDFQMAQLAQRPDALGEVEKVLSKIERAVMVDISNSTLRIAIESALRHLVVVGNVILYRDPATGKGRSIPLTNFVVRRDPLGTVLEIIIMEEIALVLLPEDVQVLIKANGAASDNDDFATVKLYTRIVRQPRRWDVTQEAGGHPVESSAGGYPIDQCPWLPLRMVVMDGEDYGRSFVEEHYADLNSLEKLTKAVVQFSAAAAKIVFGIKPNSTTNAKKLSAAESGDFVQGDLDKDVTTLQLDKAGDFQIAKSMVDALSERLSYCFLLNSALQRNGERVTAEEIRRLAQELDVGLGGTHALLAQELQLPLVVMTMAAKTKLGELPKLPRKAVKPTITTGIDALGRGTDLENLNVAFQALATIPNALARVKGAEAGKRIFASLQINSDGLFMTDEEVAEEQQRQAMAEMAKAGTPAMAKAMAEGQPTA